MQFTAFRPARVRPDEWYQHLVFVHKGSVYVGADGERQDPLADVQQQANALLGSARPAYSDVRSESLAALPRGTAMTLVPWVERGRKSHLLGAIMTDRYHGHRTIGRRSTASSTTVATSTRPVDGSPLPQATSNR